MPRTLLLPAAVVSLLLLVACGDNDTPASSGDAPTSTVQIEMIDIAFEPETIEVAAGETVRFVFTNSGDVAHEAYIGDIDAQADHEAEMRDAEGDEHSGGHGDDDADIITVEPGDSGELTHTFTESGTLELGCHQPGHYDAGMKVDIEVA